MQDSFGTTKRNLLIKALQAGTPDALLFSGGGNDIIGENFCHYLNNAADVGTCRRCKADLSLLVALERRRAALVALTQRRLAAGDVAGALPLAAEVDRLRRDEESRRDRKSTRLNSSHRL